MVDELGSEKSRSFESTQKEAQGEFGVTCKAVVCHARVRVKRKNREAISSGYLIVDWK